MNNVLLQLAMKLNNNRKRRKVWQRMVRVMAMVVVFCTTYALILPAITMQAEPVCGKEVHEHTDECYTLKMGGFACELPADTVILHRHEAYCMDLTGKLTCSLEENMEHTHDSSCYTESEVLNCPVTHVHSEACATVEKTLICTLAEDETHAHGDDCYTETVTYCSEPAIDGHSHDAACYQKSSELTCGREEVRLHTHEAGCYDGQGGLVCTLPQVAAHSHTEACVDLKELVNAEISCGLEEHVHEDSCYPLEEDAVLGPEYRCGYSDHSHGASCYHLDGTLKCNIPEHTHDTLCLINDLDLTADVETAAQWEATMEDLELTGVWAEDLLTVAKSQLGYQESKKNFILYQGELLGYNRYGAWYGNAYGNWDDMFVSFCLNYAKIDKQYVPYESDSARWVEALNEKGLYMDSRNAAPAPGDLVFMDTDDDKTADYVGIVADLLPEDEIKIIAGDTEENRVAYVTYKLTGDGILGYGKLPEKPENSTEPGQAADVSAMLAELPDANTLAQNARAYLMKGDREGFESMLKDLTSRLETIGKTYYALSEEQKAQVVGFEKLTQLLEVSGNITWQVPASLTDDSAVVSKLTADSAEVTSAVVAANEETPAETIPENAVRNQDVISYTFTAETKAYDPDQTFGQARVKVELVLPLTQDKAVFDTESMTWLEDSKLTTEYRTIGDQQIKCQVLIGYKRLTVLDTFGTVVPGSFTETLKVKLQNAAHGDKVYVQISAAMEHNDWNGTCWLHQAEEKLTVETSAFTVYSPLATEAQQAAYEAFKATIEGLAAQNLPEEQAAKAASEIQASLDEASVKGVLNYEHYLELTMMVRERIYCDLNSIAEAAIGDLWKTEVATPRQYYTPKAVKAEPKVPEWKPMEEVSFFSWRGLTSDSQIESEGGGTTSDDQAVYVSKTIAGTQQENVFDITLQIVTQDKIETVYEDPDMAVVIVTDISNTMNSLFTGESTSRYEAAMDAAEDFLDHFQQEAGDISQIGYVAFNTSATKIFDLQTCATPEKAQALATEMRNDTEAIIKASGYEESHSRFTNIEAGLKMARDMLADAPNRNKFIVFLSDGFPTTYISSGYTGYDPNCSSGNKDANGVFYDDVLNVYCKYGTSYSDTAAIRAREMAVSIKGSGIDIFSIGVDVAGQTIKRYHDSSATNAASSDKFSIVERRGDSYPNNIYEIGVWDSTSAFKNWLKGSGTTGIGSGEGYYYDSNNTAGLHAAYDAIFAEIMRINAESAHTDWVVTDPMPGMDVTEVDNIEFIAFWDNYSQLQDSLTGVQQADGMFNENTAIFDPATKTIKWDLKKSLYYTLAMEETTQYMFQMRYRVRLENEDADFLEKQIYNTNAPTSLAYRVIQVNGEDKYISEQKYVPFQIPSVFGYLSELNFLKVDPHNSPVAGAEFTLSHDTENCGACRGDGVSSVAVADQVMVSDGEGVVSFTRIPSGHWYTLKETKIPDGYTGTLNTYSIQVAYDNLTVTVTDKNGKELEWSGSIENGLFYELPSTGGVGTSHYTFGGIVLIGAAALMYCCINERKRKRGGAYCRR